MSNDGQFNASKICHHDAKEIDIESTWGANDQANISIPAHQQLQRNTLNSFSARRSSSPNYGKLSLQIENERPVKDSRKLDFRDTDLIRRLLSFLPSNLPLGKS